MSYNRYTNYETWLVCLWIDNDYFLQKEAQRIASRYNTHEQEIGNCAQAFKDWITEMLPDLGGCLAQDLMNAALSEVDWKEVSEQFIVS